VWEVEILSLDKIKQMAGDPPLPKGMEVPEGDVQKVQALSLRERNYAGEIMKALDDLDFDVAIDHLELVEDTGSLPQMNIVLTVRGE
jgi:hypothetical protein